MSMIVVKFRVRYVQGGIYVFNENGTTLSVVGRGPIDHLEVLEGQFVRSAGYAKVPLISGSGNDRV